MHGMLSSAVVLAAFAVIAGAAGYAAVWLYRTSPGGPARSRAAQEPDASGQAGEPADGDAREKAVEADGTGWPGPAVTGGPSLHELDEPRGTDEPDEPDEAGEAGEAGETKGTGWPDESPGARIYVLGRARTPSR